MIFTSLCILYFLWTRVTNIINSFFTKILRCCSRVVLQCRTLNIFDARASWSSMICIKTNNFSRNVTIWFAYSFASSRFHCIQSVLDCANRFWMLTFLLIWRHNHRFEWLIFYVLRSSWIKFHSSWLFIRLSRNRDHKIRDNDFASIISFWRNNKSFINNLYVRFINSCIMSWKFDMLN